VLTPQLTEASLYQQLVVDLKTDMMLPWQSFVLFYDDSRDYEGISALVKQLRLFGSLTVINLGDPNDVTDSFLDRLMGNVNPMALGGKFLAVTSKSVVNRLFDAAARNGMTEIDMEWLYIIPDTDSRDRDVAAKLTEAVDGNNIAFVYNASPVRNDDAADECQEGKLCMLEEFLRAYIDVMQNKWVKDAETYFDMTQEEYDLIKPKRMEEMLDLTGQFKAFLTLRGQCGKCTEWQLEASEIMEDEGNPARRLDVGMWRPVLGVEAKDHLFPHVTGGLRGRTIYVSGTHVRHKFIHYGWRLL